MNVIGQFDLFGRFCHRRIVLNVSLDGFGDAIFLDQNVGECHSFAGLGELRNGSVLLSVKAYESHS